MAKTSKGEWLRSLEASLSSMEILEENSSKNFTVRATVDLYEKIGEDSLKIVSGIKDAELRKLAEKTIDVWSRSGYSEAHFLKRAEKFTDRILFLFWEEVEGDLEALEIILRSGGYDSNVDVRGIGGRKNTTEWILERMRDPSFIHNYKKWVAKGDRLFDPSTAVNPLARLVGPGVLLLIISFFYFISR